MGFSANTSYRNLNRKSHEKIPEGELNALQNVPYFSEIIMIRVPSLVHKTLLRSLFSSHFNEIKSHFKNFAAQHARREAFFFKFFYEKWVYTWLFGLISMPKTT